ncbi:MAG: aspartate aminotransferase family protein [Desulfococcaceae bacterium]|nr:aspartate aminotransferase family protein [Desulfococcaceae bacterium]
MTSLTRSETKPDMSEGDVNLSPHRAEWQKEHMDAETRKWLDKDAQFFLHQSLSTPCLDLLTGCRGSELEDLQNRRFLDFHGNSVHQVGFANPEVLDAVRQQLDSLPFCPRRYTNIPAIQLAEKLAEIAPGDMKRVLFAPGGTTAVGMALKLARAATGRFKTVSMWGAFHGASLDAVSVGGESLFRRGIGPLLTGTEHVPPADPYHCLWDFQGRCESCGLKCARYIEYILEQEGDVAAVIAEPVRCTRINPPPEGYWRAVRNACDRHGTLLIFDETAVCLGRTGRMFACEHYGAVPDILILGKGLGGGVFPLAGILAKEELNVAADKALGHYTHEKNPTACAAGLAAIRFIEKQGLVQRSEELGNYAADRLRKMMNAHPLIGDVRGLGLLFGAELVRDRVTKEAATEEADRIMYACLSRGLSFKVSQGNFLTLTPPLTVSREELDRALSIISDSLTELEDKYRYRFPDKCVTHRNL